jgi:hypothetical protein
MHLFHRSKFGANLNLFEIKWIRFKNRIRCTVLPALPASAAPTVSPRYLTPHPAADDRAPVASRPTSQPCRPASRRPRHIPLSRGNAPPTRAAAGPLPRRCQVVALLHATPRGPLSRSLSPSPPPRGAHPSAPPPSPPLPFKTEPPLAGRIFLPRASFVSSVHAQASHTRPATAQASASPAFHHRSPSSAPDSARASPLSAPFR